MFFRYGSFEVWINNKMFSNWIELNGNGYCFSVQPFSENWHCNKIKNLKKLCHYFSLVMQRARKRKGVSYKFCQRQICFTFFNPLHDGQVRSSIRLLNIFCNITKWCSLFNIYRRSAPINHSLWHTSCG